ncbi:MAG: RNA polymerase factor sigma-54 [Endozoicomonadaceae bacterium]|nr:RNA polymerase factor sigma-54 [Endozoicomonadaceae bacterium]
MNPQLHLAQKQKLGMNMHLRQMINLLQLPSSDLLTILNEITANCIFLELETNHCSTADNVFRGAEFYGDSRCCSYDMDAYAVTATLHQQLLEQTRLLSLSPIEQVIADVLIDGINDRGYLKITPEEVLSTINIDKISVSDVLSVLEKIQQFEPSGIAARTQQECLCLQIEQYKGIALQSKQNALYLLKKYYTDLAQNDIRLLQKKTKLTQEAIHDALLLIRNLALNPGWVVSNDNTCFCIPDIIISKTDDIWHAHLNRTVSPRLTINCHYMNIVKETTATVNMDNLTYWKDELQNAKNIVNGLNKRYITLVKIANTIILKQRKFLEKGDRYLKVVSMREIATELGLHESTISRAVQNKYIQLPHKVLPMRYFFSSMVCTQGLSSVALQAHIRQLISVEPVSKPLTDTKLQHLIKQTGFDVSRRTITKYRKKLGVASARERKKQIKGSLLNKVNNDEILSSN